MPVGNEIIPRLDKRFIRVVGFDSGIGAKVLSPHLWRRVFFSPRFQLRCRVLYVPRGVRTNICHSGYLHTAVIFKTHTPVPSQWITAHTYRGMDFTLLTANGTVHHSYERSLITVNCTFIREAFCHLLSNKPVIFFLQRQGNILLRNTVLTDLYSERVCVQAD